LTTDYKNKDGCFDWYISYSAIRGVLRKHLVPEERDADEAEEKEILVAGCGNSGDDLSPHNGLTLL